MNQKLELFNEFNRLKDAYEIVKKMPPSDDKSIKITRVDKIKNYIIFADKLIEENKDVGIIIDRIHQLINDLVDGI